MISPGSYESYICVFLMKRRVIRSAVSVVGIVEGQQFIVALTKLTPKASAGCTDDVTRFS